MVCVRRGTAMKTPKKASESDHSSSCPGLKVMAPDGGFCADVIIPSAGMMPTRPAGSSTPNTSQCVPLYHPGLLGAYHAMLDVIIPSAGMMPTRPAHSDSPNKLTLCAA